MIMISKLPAYLIVITIIIIYTTTINIIMIVIVIVIITRWLHISVHGLSRSLGISQAEQGLHSRGEDHDDDDDDQDDADDHDHDYDIMMMFVFQFQWMLLLLLLLVSESVGTVLLLLYREPALHHVQVDLSSCFCISLVKLTDDMLLYASLCFPALYSGVFFLSQKLKKIEDKFDKF